MAGFTHGLLSTTNTICSRSLIIKKTLPYFQRLASYRKNCKIMDTPICNKENIVNSSCYKDIIEGRVLPDHPLGKIWDKPECCNEPCKDYYSRFDDLYYFISDKSKRNYTRTWKECPKVVRCKRFCCFDGKERSPPFKKRPKNHVIDTACPGSTDCQALTGKACEKLKMPGCKSVRGGSLSCKKWFRTPCQKFCTPYPSYSECLRDYPIELKKEECLCLTRPMQCDLVGLKIPHRLPRCQNIQKINECSKV